MKKTYIKPIADIVITTTDHLMQGASVHDSNGQPTSGTIGDGGTSTENDEGDAKLTPVGGNWTWED